MAAKLIQFITRDIWRIPVRKMKGPHGFLIRSLRIFVLSFREFASDNCSLRASALTFYSLLSIVPVVAMAFGVAKGFGMDKLLREKLMENLQGQEEALNRILQFSDTLLENAKGGVIAGIGLMLLFWTVIQVLSNIEISFNHIWGIKKQRTLGRKFTDYLSLMLIAPVFFIVASSATVFIVSQVTLITEKIAILGPLGPVILTSLRVIPFAVFWGLLTYLYMFLPNGKIRFTSALLGGVVAGTLYQLVQWGYIHFQIGVSKAGAIYGSFAALPLFLAWLQMSWLVVLYGAELAFAHQNEERFEFEQDCLAASEEFKKLLSLRLTQLCVSRFSAGLEPVSAEVMATELEMPVRLVRDLLDRLTHAGILAAMQGPDDRVPHYQPARDVGEMTVAFVIEKMEMTGAEDVPVAVSPELEKLRSSLHRFREVVRNLPENVLLKDLSSAPSKIYV